MQVSRWTIVLLVPLGLWWTTAWCGARTEPAAVQVADSLNAAGQWQASRAMLDSLLVSATAHGETRIALWALVRRGGGSTYRGQLETGERDLHRALAMAPATGDTLAWCEALRALCLTALSNGREREAAPLARQLRTLALRTGDPREIARSHVVLAYEDLLEGRLVRARAGYRLAVSELATLGPDRELAECHIGLARVDAALGDADAARAEYQALIAGHGGLTGAVTIANAWNNLGNIEMDDGDPTTALADWGHALPIYEHYGKVAFAGSTRLNVAEALEDQGRLEDAAHEAAALVDTARTRDVPGLERLAQSTLADIRVKEERFGDALAASEAALTAADSLPPITRVAAGLARCAALAGLGRTDSALAGLQAIRTHEGDHLERFQRRQIARAQVELEIRAGRPRVARDQLSARDGSADWYDHYLRARCDDALGDRAEARLELGRACAGWERWRGRPSDPEWREARGPQARDLYGELLHLLWTAPPAEVERDARRTFDALQAFKARTLFERMRTHAGAGLDSLATLAWMQQRGLRDGELFLDLYAGPDSVVAFAVTRHAFRWRVLGSSATLLGRAARMSDLFAADHGDRATAIPACDDAAVSLGTSVLAVFGDLVSDARRVLVAADGALAEIPYEALEVRGRPVIEGRELARLPSATVLRALRPARTAKSSGPWLAVVGATDGGRALPGAAAEVAWLERHVPETRVSAASGVGRRAALLGDLARCRGLHIAAHTEVNVEAPWRSGILLDDTEAASERGYLRASAIADLGVHARLVVLSGCRSYGSRAVFGEGVLGLSSAFLSAGAPAIVCTLWPVDDRSTATFMEDFYRRLADDDIPAHALRLAQLDTRARAATRHPFYWAGFVLVGDPETHAGLHPTPASTTHAARTRGTKEEPVRATIPCDGPGEPSSQ